MKRPETAYTQTDSAYGSILFERNTLAREGLDTMEKMRHYLLVSLIFIALQFGAHGPVSAASGDALKPVELKVLQLPYISFAPFFIAEEEGYFKDQGLDVEFIKMRQSTEALPALIQGDLDVMAGFVNIGLFNAMAKGENIKVVADKGYMATSGCAANAFVVRKGLTKIAMKQAGLKSFRYAINKASIEGYLLEQLLAEEDLTTEDLTIETIFNPAAELAALKKGAVDIAIVGEPWLTRIEQAEAGSLLERIGKSSPDFQSAAIVFGNRLLSENPDAGQRFMTAYLKAVRQYAEGKTKRNLEILAHHTKMETELLEELCWPQFHVDGSINAESISQFADWAVTKGLLDKAVGPDVFWDPRFINKANEVLKNR